MTADPRHANAASQPEWSTSSELGGVRAPRLFDLLAHDLGGFGAELLPHACHAGQLGLVLLDRVLGELRVDAEHVLRRAAFGEVLRELYVLRESRQGEAGTRC